MQIYLFDIDGTLIHSGGAGRAAINIGMSEAFSVESSSEFELGGRTDRGIASELFETHDIAPTDANWRRFVSAYLDALPSRLHAREGGVLPGVESLLSSLAELANVHVGLLTGNIRRGAEIKLTHFRLWDFFDFGGFGDNSPKREDVAREAAQDARNSLAADLRDDQFCVIGDTILDVRCAKAIGAKSVAVCTGSGSRSQLAAESPDLLLDSLDDDDWWRHIMDN
jgi:phosphoglycolate phosphatase-like HAD superfamily hydrolase